MKSLSQIANESLNKDDVTLAIEHNEIFYTKRVIEQLIEDLSGQRAQLTEASLKDLMKKWGFDMSDKIRKELEAKSKAWKIELSKSELDQLVAAGAEDGFRGGYRIKDNSEIMYVTWNELSKSTSGKNWGYSSWM